MIIWRIWQVRTDYIHGKELPPVESTVDFLVSYFNSLRLVKNFGVEEILEGKDAGNPEICKLGEHGPPHRSAITGRRIYRLMRFQPSDQATGGPRPLDRPGNTATINSYLTL